MIALILIQTSGYKLKGYTNKMICFLCDNIVSRYNTVLQKYENKFVILKNMQAYILDHGLDEKLS